MLISIRICKDRADREFEVEQHSLARGIWFRVRQVGTIFPVGWAQSQSAAYADWLHWLYRRGGVVQ